MKSNTVTIHAVLFNVVFNMLGKVVPALCCGVVWYMYSTKKKLKTSSSGNETMNKTRRDTCVVADETQETWYLFSIWLDASDKMRIGSCHSLH